MLGIFALSFSHTKNYLVNMLWIEKVLVFPNFREGREVFQGKRNVIY